MKRRWIAACLPLVGAAWLLGADDATGVKNYMPPVAPSGVLYPSGPCVVAATGLSRNCDCTNPDPQDYCVLLLTFYPDPQLGALSYSDIFNPDSATDELGHSLVGPPLVTTGRGGTQSVPSKQAFKRVEKNTALQSEVALHLPADAGKRVIELKGTVHLRAPGKCTTLDVPAAEFAAPHTIDFHGCVVTVAAIRNLRQAPSIEYAVSVNIDHPGLSPDEWAEVSQLVDVAKLEMLDDKGVAWTQNGGGGGTGTNNRSVSAQFSADGYVPPGGVKPGVAVSFRLTLPDEIKDTPIRFEFKNLPIP